MARIDRLLERQTERLDRLMEAQARRMVSAFDDARRELRERLEAMLQDGRATRDARPTPGGRGEGTPWTAQRTRVALALTEQAVRDLSGRLGAELDGGLAEVRGLAGEDLLQVIRDQEPSFLLTGNDVSVRTLARVTADHGLALHRYSLERYSADTVDQVQRRLSSALARGEDQRGVIEAIAGVDGVVARYGRARAALIGRMELSRAYNDGHIEGIKEFAAFADVPQDPVLKRILEVRDNRNHPASRVAHGMTARPDEPFRLPVDPVEAEFLRMFPDRDTVRVTGMVWPKVGDHWEGMAPPIHYNDRGRVVPWRASWAAKGELKRPRTARTTVEALDQVAVPVDATLTEPDRRNDWDNIRERYQLGRIGGLLRLRKVATVPHATATYDATALDRRGQPVTVQVKWLQSLRVLRKRLLEHLDTASRFPEPHPLVYFAELPADVSEIAAYVRGSGTTKLPIPRDGTVLALSKRVREIVIGGRDGVVRIRDGRVTIMKLWELPRR